VKCRVRYRQLAIDEPLDALTWKTGGAQPVGIFGDVSVAVIKTVCARAVFAAVLGNRRWCPTKYPREIRSTCH
jgi:hypothetical protein